MNTLITDRLIIQSIEVKDYSDICEYGCDEDTRKYMIYVMGEKYEFKIY